MFCLLIFMYKHLSEQHYNKWEKENLLLKSVSPYNLTSFFFLLTFSHLLVQLQMLYNIKYTTLIKKYGECLNTKIYYSKRHIAILPSLRIHLFHRSYHFLKQFCQSSFLTVFSCAVVAASMSWIDSKRLPFMVIFTLGKSQKSHGARSGNKVVEDTP